jgi:hypothetical protein
MKIPEENQGDKWRSKWDKRRAKGDERRPKGDKGDKGIYRRDK